MYPVEFFEYYLERVTGDAADVEDVTRRYGVRSVIWDLVSPMAVRLWAQLAANPQWRLVYLDHAAAIFTTDITVPTVDLGRRIAEIESRDLTKPFLPRLLGGKPLPYPALNLPAFLETIGRPDLALRTAEPLWNHVHSEPLAALIGTAAIQTNSIGDRIPWLESALAEYPHSIDLKTLLFAGLAREANRLLGQGHLDVAERYLNRMLTLEPGACGPYTGLAKIAVLGKNRAQAKAMVERALANDNDGSCRRGTMADPDLASLL